MSGAVRKAAFLDGEALRLTRQFTAYGAALAISAYGSAAWKS